MAHEVETMAYAGSVPWHGLGTEVSNDLTPIQMMQKAGVDWEVEQQEIIKETGIRIKDKVALVRKSDNTLLDVTGKDWKLHNLVEKYHYKVNGVILRMWLQDQQS